VTSFLFLAVSLWIGFLLDDEFNVSKKDFWGKLSYSIIIGSFVSTWLTFIVSLFIGFTKLSIFCSIIILAIYSSYAYVSKSKNCLWFKNDVFIDRSVKFVHICLLVFIMPFFIFGFWESKAGDIMYLGNYTDLSYHISMISSFLEQNIFPPENPQYAGAKLAYHFMVNFHSAILNMGGFNIFLSVFLPQVLFAFALATMLYYFYRKISGNELSTFFSVSLFIMGHIAFFNFLFALFGQSLADMKFDITSWHSVKEYLLFPYFNFLDPIINYFHPQRPFLFAFPLALIILSNIYAIFIQEEVQLKNLIFLSFLVGLLPLFHIHTFIVIVPIFVLTVIFKSNTIKKTILSLLPIMLAIGQIWFLISQPKALNFSGFDVNELGGGLTELNILFPPLLSRIIFWIRVAGFPLILGFIGVFFYFRENKDFSLKSLEGRKNIILSIFFLIFLAFFLLINFYRISPNWGDSNKIFLYFNLMLSLFAGILLKEWFEKNRLGKVLSIVLIMISSILPSLLEASSIFIRPGAVLFSACDRNTANWIKINTPNNAIFLTSDDVIHYVPSLGGRKVVNGSYTWQTGFEKPEARGDVKKIYLTGDQNILQKYNISYILVGPQEKRNFMVNERSLNAYKLVFNQECRGVSYKIFDVHQKSLIENAKQETNVALLSKGDRVFLSDLTPTQVFQSHENLKFDVNFNDEPIILNGQRYEKGLGSHANSKITFQLNKKFTFFESDIGLDDTEAGSPGSVIFKVYVDEKLAYKSPVMRWKSKTEHLRVNLRKGDNLTLIVEDAGDGDTCDHASWANANLIID
jgi:hypothetical protein